MGRLLSFFNLPASAIILRVPILTMPTEDSANMQPTLDDARWIGKLADSLVHLAESQAHYEDDLVQIRQHQLRGFSAHPSRYDPHPESDNLCCLYRQALADNSPDLQHYYQPLRTALQGVLATLRQHPVLDRVSAVPDGKFDFRLDITGHQAAVQLLEVAVGLITRFPERSRANCAQAARELGSLLNLDCQGEMSTLPDKLNTGHRLLLFFGLEPTERVRVSETMHMVPFEEVKDFVGTHLLDRIAHDVINLSIAKRISAILSPFTWKPVLARLDECKERQEVWGFKFYRDASHFLHLLSVFYGLPVVPLANVYHGIRPDAARLLGHLNFRSQLRRNLARPAIDPFAPSIPLPPDNFDAVVLAFARRNSPQSQRYAAIVPRLAESLARRGPFAQQDKILDVAITLERLYELDSDGISFKLKTRAACFLEIDTQGRKRVFEQLSEFYKVRSAIVHYRKKSKRSAQQLSPRNLKRTFTIGFELARGTLMKLLAQGPPDNWDELVISAPDTHISS